MIANRIQRPLSRGINIATGCLIVLCALAIGSGVALAESGDEPQADAPRTPKITAQPHPKARPRVQRARPPRTIPPRKTNAPGPTASAPKQPAFRWPNEEFYFSIRFNGIEAMRAILRSGALQHAKNRAYIPISAFAQSVGFFHNVYPLVDRANTFMDPVDCLPIRSEKHFEERGQTRIYKVDFLADRFRAEVSKSRNTKKSRYNNAIPGQTHDMLSWFYDFRARPDFKVGDKFAYYIYDGWKFSRVDMKVEGKEDVYTPMGWFKSWKIRFIRQVMNTRRKRDKKKQPLPPKLSMKTPNDHSGHLWVSRDANRLPIKVAIDSQFGTGIAVLIKYKPHQKTQTLARDNSP